MDTFVLHTCVPTYSLYFITLQQIFTENFYKLSSICEISKNIPPQKTICDLGSIALLLTAQYDFNSLWYHLVSQKFTMKEVI